MLYHQGELLDLLGRDMPLPPRTLQAHVGAMAVGLADPARDIISQPMLAEPFVGCIAVHFGFAEDHPIIVNWDIRVLLTEGDSRA
ncbi:MAG TPA: hypothetical protein VFP57_08195, partial [Sphingomicrobium sp.]|nr:hypothetical protein [Sphingomicrobium sp.]